MKRLRDRGVRVIDRKSKSTYQKRPRESNYLKNWRIVRHYITKKHGLSIPDLDFILYMYDETVFTRAHFDEYCGILKWNKFRFREMNERGIIRKWRESTGREANLYELTLKAKLICSEVYKKLEGEKIPEHPTNNEIMKGKSYSDKVYRTAIKRMNAKYEQQSRGQ